MQKITLFSMKKKLVVFDLDGTLLYTLPDIRRAVNYALSAYDIPLISMEEAREIVGRGLRNALIAAVNRSGKLIEDNDFSLMNELMVSSYMKHPSDNTVPYDGIPELLGFLTENGLMVAIASNKKDEIVQKIVKNILPSIRFAFVLGQTSSYPLKPDPEGILSETANLGVTSDDIVYVGDSEVDYETASNLGCDKVIVSYGYRTAEELKEKGIDNTAATTKELGERLRALCL